MLWFLPFPGVRSLTHSMLSPTFFFQQTGVIETREQRSKSASEVDLSVVVSVSKAWSLRITQTVFWLVMKSSPTRGKNALSNAKNVCVGRYLACYLLSFSLFSFLSHSKGCNTSLSSSLHSAPLFKVYAIFTYRISIFLPFFPDILKLPPSSPSFPAVLRT